MSTIPVEHGLILAGDPVRPGLDRRAGAAQHLFLMSIEIMLNAAGLAFIVAGARWGSPTAR
jgi:NADH-quinone oxidoreductase subunit K